MAIEGPIFPIPPRAPDCSLSVLFFACTVRKITSQISANIDFIYQWTVLYGVRFSLRWQVEDLTNEYF